MADDSFADLMNSCISQYPNIKVKAMKATEAHRVGHGSHAAASAWLGDAVGAALMAAGLALGVSAIAGVGPLNLGWGALLLVAGGGFRAVAQWFAADLGMKAAAARKAAARATHWSALVGTSRALRLSGTEASRAVDSIEMLEGLEARYQPLRLAAVVAPLLVAAGVALASPVSAAILLLTLIPFVAGLALAGTAARAAADRQLGALRDLNGLFVDRLRALPEIRHFGAEDRILRQMAEVSRDLAARTITTLRIAFLSSGVIDFFAAIAVALVALYTGFNLLGILPVEVPEALGLLAAFYVLAMAPEFYTPFRRLAAAYHDKQLGEAAEADLAAMTVEAARPETGLFSGLAVTHLCIRHPDGPLIGPLSFELPPTGLTVILGPTGSGKSSLLAALAGRVPVVGGSIAWREGAAPPIAWAGQRPLILAGTLASNMALARPGATADEIDAAVRSLGLERLLQARGLEELDWRGSGLSGGERRRIGVARALLSGRPLLLLDEPTADLDSESAAIVRTALVDASRSRALLVATHDEALAAQAGSVLRLG